MVHMRRLLAIIAGLLAAAAAPLAPAQIYPAKPVRLVVTISGGSDAPVRLMAQKLSDGLGQPVVMEAQAGAGGSVGATTVSRAAPDGYTVLFATTGSMVMRQFVSKNTPYDAVRDFTPITTVAESISGIVATASLPVSSLAELIEYARRNPRKVSFGTSGIGTSHHLSAEMIMQLTGVDMVHVPYKSGGQSVIDLVGGRIPVLFGVLATVMTQVSAGKAKLIAINSGKRYAKLPDVPIVGEAVAGYERPPGWMGYLGPAGLPRPIVKRLDEEIRRAMALADVRAKFAEFDMVVDVLGPDEFAALIRTNIESVAKAVKKVGIQPGD
jgi:tripartite-type tricarboxylate transporter receptor subunit TctC